MVHMTRKTRRSTTLITVTKQFKFISGKSKSIHVLCYHTVKIWKAKSVINPNIWCYNRGAYFSGIKKWCILLPRVVGEGGEEFIEVDKWTETLATSADAFGARHTISSRTLKTSPKSVCRESYSNPCFGVKYFTVYTCLISSSARWRASSCSSRISSKYFFWSSNCWWLASSSFFRSTSSALRTSEALCCWERRNSSSRL